MIPQLKTDKKISCYKDVTRVCLPLVLGMSATTVMEFTDRVFLANFSLDAVAAAMPAGITAFLFMAFLGGIGGYTNVFIAQYTGRGDHSKVGVVLWQGIYFCLLSAIIFLLLGRFSGSFLFNLVDHQENIKTMEIQYYTILCYGGVFHVALNTFSTFFSGRGITKPVMFVYFVGMAINIPLDYCLIFGKWIFPELGIQGAAIATVVAWVVPTLLLLIMIFTKSHIQRFSLWKHRGFHKDIFIRILRFGIPGSLQFTIDILAFTIFILMVGRIGTLELAATTIVISINSLAFMPSMGVSQGVSILVGQALGRKKPALAKAVVWNSAHLLLAYVFIAGVCFLVIPEQILSLFIPDDTIMGYNEILSTSVLLLKIVAAYLFFDSMYMIFTGALKGAGDTKFIMWSVLVASTTLLILPCFIGIEFLGLGLYFSWTCILIFVASLFCLSAFRYRQGKWLNMLVIEAEEEKKSGQRQAEASV